MPESGGEVLATRVALLELGEERRLVQEGHELLDEKRMMLASEILRRLRLHAELDAAASARALEARAALQQAVSRHGWQDLALAPAATLESAKLEVPRTAFLGLEVAGATLEDCDPTPTEEPAWPTPELRLVASAFQRYAAALAAIAAEAASLRRLAREYRRTERRARALENVVLPEIDLTLRFVVEQLDSLDLEEAVRVRNAAGASSAGVAAARTLDPERSG